MVIQFTIGQLAKLAGIDVQTVRYYEKRKLLSPSSRRPSGYRIYDHEVVTRLRFIRNAQGLGFTLREIGELLSLRATTGTRCEDVQRKAEAKLQCLETKLKDLQALVRALRSLIRTCRAGQPLNRCQIVNQLEKQHRPTVQTRKRK